MATKDRIELEHVAVDEAWHELLDPLADCQSLIELYKEIPEHGIQQWSTLAVGAMSRLCRSIDAVESVQAQFGRLPLKERPSLVDHPQ